VVAYGVGKGSTDERDINLDLARARRTGIPEVVFAERKTYEQIERIMCWLWNANGFVLATRVPVDFFDRLSTTLPAAVSNFTARVIRCGALPSTRSTIGVISAGTSDLPVAEEAAFCAESFGNTVIRRNDVGVAGIHRLLEALPAVQDCAALIVVAGMEGTLPGIVAGLVSAPVIAVPTSVGYGVAAGGVAALHTMLASCAPGIGVVNIDNGFGAAALAHKIARSTQP
jgi:NCAIR mutase (PurE)-related protein